jgi:hypothetical protein
VSNWSKSIYLDEFLRYFRDLEVHEDAIDEGNQAKYQKGDSFLSHLLKVEENVVGAKKKEFSAFERSKNKDQQDLDSKNFITSRRTNSYLNCN